jgi:hypothetical protein
MELIPQIIFEESIEFDDEATYNNFIIYCEWYLFDGNIDELDNELCLTFRELCSLYIEPNYIDRLQKNE